jgi:hypothetical protein
MEVAFEQFLDWYVSFTEEGDESDFGFHMVHEVRLCSVQWFAVHLFDGLVIRARLCNAVASVDICSVQSFAVH